MGAFCSLQGVIFMDKLPKTRSGKILRATIKKIANGQEYKFPAAIEDVSALDYVKMKTDEWKASHPQK